MRSIRERAVIGMSPGCNKVRADPLLRSEA
jgi:hypothetical protein